MVIRDKRPPQAETRTEYIRDLSGGQVSAVSSISLRNKEAQMARNTTFNLRGALQLRKGFRKRYAASIGESAILGIGTLYKSDGTSRLVVAVDDRLYYDKPHYAYEFDTADDFNRGTMKWANTTSVPGSLTYDSTGAPLDIVTTYEDEDGFNSGTHIDTEFSHIEYAGSSLHAAYPSDLSLDSTFSGERNNLIPVDEFLVLDCVLTFERYEHLTFDELIAL